MTINNSNSIIKSISKKNYPKRFCYMLFGMLLSAISFNVFFKPYNIVTGGTSGISLIARELFEIDTSIFITISAIILIIVSLIFLGIKTTLATLAGAITYPLFIELTTPLTNIINVETNSIFLISIFGGVIGGFASGIVLKNGFSMGGTQIIIQIMTKYLKISIGTSSLILNTLIIIGASLVFGIPKSLCAIISLYIASKVTDRVILGTSDKKVFYIITKKDTQIKEYIINSLSHSISEIDAIGGYTNKKKKMLMCTIPTNEYYMLKDVILKIDEDAFFLILDTYEVVGGS